MEPFYSSLRGSDLLLRVNKKHLKNVGPIRDCKPPHAHSPGVATGTVARCLRIDVHNDNDNAWQRGPLWPHGMGPIINNKGNYGNCCAKVIICDVARWLLFIYCCCLLVVRCTSGIEGLKEQGVTNYITLTFIMKYDVLFLQPDETSPYSPDFILVKFSICSYVIIIAAVLAFRWSSIL